MTYFVLYRKRGSQLVSKPLKAESFRRFFHAFHHYQINPSRQRPAALNCVSKDGVLVDWGVRSKFSYPTEGGNT